MDEYPGPEKILNPKVPGLLQCFIDTVITSKSQDQEGVKLKRSTVGQILMYNYCQPCLKLV